MEDQNDSTYRKDYYYINRKIGGYRNEKVVSAARFYFTWFWWFLFMPHYIKYKLFNVLYQGEAHDE